MDMIKRISAEGKSSSIPASGVACHANVAVCVPVYRCKMSAEEESSFRQTVKIFGPKRSIIAFAPEGLDLINYTSIYPDLQVERFPAHFFRSVCDYSRLLLSVEFYQRFSHFEWLLICQLDVWVFRDDLDHWCSSKYDFIGAPISARWELAQNGLPPDIVGNGGFSLRRISAFINVLQAHNVPMYSPENLLYFLKRHLYNLNLIRGIVPLLRLIGIGNSRGYCLNILRKQGVCEDMVFRLIEQSGYQPSLLFPDLREAALFALDGDGLWKYFELSGKKIPMALHAFHRKEGKEFLESIKGKSL